MKQQKVFFSPVGIDEIREVVEQTIQKEIAKIQTPPPSDEIVSRIKAAQILGISLPTLDIKTKSGEIKGYRIGKRVKYKMDELKASLTKIKTEIK